MLRCNWIRYIITALAFTTLAACGGSSGGSSSSASSSSAASSSSTSSSSTSTGTALTKAEAYRFLNQASFGATEAEAQRLMSLGDVSTAHSRWIDEQVALPPSLALAVVEAAYPNPVPTGFNVSSLQGARVDAWLGQALTGSDQLRQRMAFALSQIMVVSQIGALQDYPFAVADYHDLLMRNALGDFRQLLEAVTLHPAMGVYLSMLGNQKASNSIRPDENYARELMQLMSIGLIELNMDGTPRLDGQGQTIPTYNQAIIEGFARVYTGWKWACPSTTPNCNFGNTRAQLAPLAGYNQIKPMQFFSPQHETGTKQVLSYPGAAFSTIPQNQTGAQDLRDALDNLYNHPNVAPFISKQLIQKLVTSNPSPAYVQRVAQRFNDDGTGRRGNLEAVARAILLDTEARTAATGAALATTGKVKEPLLRVTQFWRAYGAHAASGKITTAGNFQGGNNLQPSVNLGQGPEQSPSVFNFFSPFYAPPGEIANQNLVAPELQIATEYLNTLVTNLIWTNAANRTTAQTTLGADILFIDTREETALAGNATALVNRVAERLLGGANLLSQTLRDQTVAQVNRSTTVTTRVADAIYLIASSPEYTVLK